MKPTRNSGTIFFHGRRRHSETSAAEHFADMPAAGSRRALHTASTTTMGINMSVRVNLTTTE